MTAPGARRTAAGAIARLAVAWCLCACGPRPPARAARPDAPDDPLAALVTALPEGATACLAVRTARVADRRRASAEAISLAGSLAWARTPHVRAYVRCDVGTNDARVELVLVDDLDVTDRAAVHDALSLSVRWAGEACVHDECDWPELRALGSGALELRRRAPTGVTGPGVERALADLARARPEAVELSVSGEGTRVVVPVSGGLEVSERRGRARDSVEAWTWEELELAVEDRRISEGAVSAHADDLSLRTLEDLSTWSAELTRSQLDARVSRARRASRRATDAEREAIAVVARHGLSRWPGDLFLVAEAARALAFVSAAHEALGVVDALALRAAGDEVLVRALERLGREIALAARDASLTERLVRAGVALDGAAASAVAQSLGALVETHGMDYAAAEDAVRAAHERITDEPALAATELRVGARALAPLFWLLGGDRSTSLVVELWLRGAGVEAAAARASPGLVVVGVLDGLYVHAVGRPAERHMALGEILEAALEEGPPGRAFELVLRSEEGGAVHIVRATGTAEDARVLVSAASPEVAAVAPGRLERVLADPLEALFERRFPVAELRWPLSGGDPARPDLERALRLAGVRGCHVSDAMIACDPGAAGASEGLPMIVAVAQALGVLP